MDGEIDLIFNTTEGWQSHKDSQSIRASAIDRRVPYYTTAAASAAVVLAIASVRAGGADVSSPASALEVRSLQDYYG